MKWSVIIAAIILSGIFLLTTPGKLNTKQLQETLASAPINYRLEYIEPPFNEQVKEAIYQLSSPSFRRADLRLEQNDILDELDQLAKASDILSLTPDTLTGDNKKLAIRLRSLLINIQVKDFPILREHFIFCLRQSLSNQNIVVNYSDEALQLEGLLFTKTELVESFNNQLMKTFQKLRIRKVIYKWIKNDDDPTCFEVSNGDDRDIGFNAYN